MKKMYIIPGNFSQLALKQLLKFLKINKSPPVFFIPTLNILKNFPKVEKITIRTCMFRNQFASDLKLEHLKELEFNYGLCPP